MRIFFRLWLLGTLVWAGFCWMMLPHGLDMAPAFAFAILMPSCGILAIVFGISWAFRRGRARTLRTA